MVSPAEKTLHEVAWNGIRFQVPSDWLPFRIERNYLVLERDAVPVMEIKWGRIRGRFSRERHLQLLAVRQKKKAGRAVRSCELPPDWEKALAAYRACGFQWQEQKTGATGALLYCPVCRNATLVQFYQNDPAPEGNLLTRILASFRDHSQGDAVLWSAFDIRVAVPSFLQLRRHRFEPGYFELAFASKKHTVILNRWGPASVLLAGRDLSGFAASAAALPKDVQPHLSGDDPPTVMWSASQANNPWRRAANRLKVKPTLQQLCMWLVAEENRILAVRTEGRRPLAPQVFDALCRGFRCA